MVQVSEMDGLDTCPHDNREHSVARVNSFNYDVCAIKAGNGPADKYSEKSWRT